MLTLIKTRKNSAIKTFVLKRIVQVVKLCAEQGFRGHRDNCTEGFTRDGNFMAILKAFVKIDPVLNDHLSDGPANSQMNS